MSVERHPTEDLPAYALGALDAAENAAIADHVERCDQCTRDLARFQDALYEAAAIGAVDVDAPRNLRARIVLRHRGSRPATATSWAARIADIFMRPVPLAIPAVLAVILLVSLAIVGLNRQQNDRYERALAGVADGRVVALAPTGANPDARASVVIPKQGQPYLVVRLPAPPSGKTWEAWVLKPGPTAVPAGTSNAGDIFILPLTAPLGAGDGVAITLEPIAGSQQPTTAPVLVVERT
jgi:anti-sigma factor RsiW